MEIPAIGFEREYTVIGASEVPSFAMPPIVEAVIGFEFAPIAGLGMRGLSDFYERVKGNYPVLEEQVLFQPAELGPFAAVPSPRFWMTREDQSDLVQLQADRLLLNWRRREGGSDYARYANQRQELERLVGTLEGLVNDRGFQQPIPLWAEATYVNRIEFADGKKPHEFFVLVSGAADLPGVAQETRFQEVRSVTSESDDAWEGRSTITVEPFRDPESTGAMMTVVTRVALTGADTLGDAFPALDYARETSVKTFVAATTAEMHERWGREA